MTSNIADLISRQAALKPERSAVLIDERPWSYAAFDQAVWRAARWLLTQGVQAGEMVVVSLASREFHLIAINALARIGAVQASVFPWEPAAAKARLVADAAAGTALTDGAGEGFERCRTLRPDADVFAVESGAGDVAIDRSIGHPGIDRSIGHPGGAAACCLVASSGTTGSPKFFLLTHDQMIARLDSLRPMAQRDDERVLAMLDLHFHMEVMVLLNAMAGGGAYHTVSDHQPAALIAYLDRHRINRVTLVPNMAQALVNAAAPARNRLPHLDRACILGATVSEALFNSFREHVNPVLTVAYGTTECGIATSAEAAARDQTPMTVGRPEGGCEVEIVDGNGHPQAPGAVGEIRLRTPGMAAGYLTAEPDDARSFRDGWFHPRDLGYITPDGLLVHMGRADDLMIFAGVNIYPAEIERVLLTHPAVKEAVAFPLPSADLQSVPVAVVTADGAVTMEELTQYCRDALGSRAPVMVFKIAAIPRGPLGKPLTSAMIEFFSSRVAIKLGG